MWFMTQDLQGEPQGVGVSRNCLWGLPALGWWSSLAWGSSGENLRGILGHAPVLHSHIQLGFAITFHVASSLSSPSIFPHLDICNSISTGSLCPSLIYLLLCSWSTKIYSKPFKDFSCFYHKAKPISLAFRCLHELVPV